MDEKLKTKTIGLPRYLQIRESCDMAQSDDPDWGYIDELLDHAAATVPMPIDLYLPAENQEVLLFCEQGWRTGVHNGRGSFTADGIREDWGPTGVTHWMPVPPEPESK